MTYSVRNSSWKYSFDDNTSAFTTNDTKSKTRSIVDQIDYFQLDPFAV